MAGQYHLFQEGAGKPESGDFVLLVRRRIGGDASQGFQGPAAHLPEAFSAPDGGGFQNFFVLGQA